MILEVTESEDFTRTIPTAGLELAILYSIVDMGSQSTKFGDKRQVELTWELPGQTHVFKEEEGPQTLVVSKRFTMSLNKKAGLFKAVKSMLGVEPTNKFEIFDLLGNNSLLNLVHEVKGEDTYCNIDSIILNKSVEEIKQPENPLVGFDLDNYDHGTYTALPEWKQKVIAESKEYKSLPDEGQ